MRLIQLAISILILLQILIYPVLSQQEEASWKQDIPLPRNQRITLWLERGWLKAARLNEKNELLWAVVLSRWNPKDNLRIEHQGAGVNVFGPNDELILRNSIFDSYPPMVLRCTHVSVVPDTNVLIDPATFGLKRFAPSGFTDDGHLISQSVSSEWIYVGTSSMGSSRFQYLIRMLPNKLFGDRVDCMVGTDGIRAKAREFGVYDENGFLFVEQMSDSRAKRALDPLEPILDKKAPPLRIQYWLNARSPLDLDSLRGSVVLLYFWAIWCQPCVAHLSDVQLLASTLKHEPFRLLTIHTLSSSNQLESFLRSHDCSLPIGVDSGKTLETFAQNTVPQYVLIDKKGFVKLVSADPPSDAILRRLLRE